MTNKKNAALPAPLPREPFIRKRKLFLFLMVGSAGMLAVNHQNAVREGNIFLGILLFAPFGLLLGLGGLIDPRIPRALTAAGKSLPLKFKFMGVLLLVFSLALMIYLTVRIYHVNHWGAPASPTRTIRLPR